MPVGKIVKGGKVFIKLADKQGAEVLVEATKFTVKLSENNIAHISKHIPSEFANQVSYLSDTALKKKLDKTTFFNPSWSKDEVVNAAEQAYADAIKKDVTTGLHSFKYNGETVNVYLKNGKFDTAYGTHKLNPEYFGR